MLVRQDLILDAAFRAQRDKDLYHIKTHDSVNPTTFPVHSYVLECYENDDHRPPHKLKTVLRGPHKVVDYHRERNVYTVQNLATNKLEDFHEHHFQPFYYDPEHVNPYAEALKDKQLYVIEKIISHTGNPRFCSKMRFTVKWSSGEEPTIESWNNISSTIQLHTYLREHNLEKLIPKKNRVIKTNTNS